MHLKSLKLLNFKNHEELEVDFSEEINCFVGENGVGKTNLLDAIHYLCLTKSAIGKVEGQSVRHESDYYMVAGSLMKGERNYSVLCSYQKRKKVFKLNKKEYQKVSEHIGKFPAVIMLPTDTELIQEGSETRRKFFDSIISQLDRNYLQSLIRYNHALKQRNALLKQFYEQRFSQKDLIEPFDVVLSELALEISTKRVEFINQFIPVFQTHYQQLTQQKEEVSLSYSTTVSDAFLHELRENFQRDLQAQRTTQGIHKDDFEFLLESRSLKKFGSQGQQKSYVVSLKLAQFEFMYEQTNTKPILLMDDIFDKLDDNRIAQLLKMLSADKFGQVFITDARPERSKSLLNGLDSDIKILNISHLNASI
ncbi:MAG: DNA replication and repair protein RecF [Flammeovirgaceae bacterium]|jgi:DNA replication and repair protein RecF